MLNAKEYDPKDLLDADKVSTSERLKFLRKIYTVTEMEIINKAEEIQ
jgi:hypothetical protein